MSYPNTFLTRPIRRMIMIFLILLFFVISPLILGYTAGYRYDLATGEIHQTGVISVDIEPREATVRLNGTIIDDAIPVRLTNMAPGTYHISISHPGKKTWERDITVQSRQTTYIRGITLFEDALPIEIFQDPGKRIESVAFSSTGEHAIIIEAHEPSVNQLPRYTLSLFDTNSHAVEVLFSLTADEPPTISWSPYDERAFVHSQESGQHSVSYIHPLALAPVVHTLSYDTLPVYQWTHTQNSPTLILSAASTFIELSDTRIRDLQEKNVAPVWFMDETRVLWTFDTETFTITNGTESFITTEPIDRIISITDNRIIAANNNRIILIRRDEEQRHAIISAFSSWYSPATKEWLVWTPWELATIYPEGNKEILNRTSDPISAVRPLDSYGLLLLATKDGLLGFNPGFYVTHDLFRGGDIQSVGVQQTRRHIYFYGTVATKTGIFQLNY